MLDLTSALKVAVFVILLFSRIVSPSETVRKTK
jgi:hypothetical protein